MEPQLSIFSLNVDSGTFWVLFVSPHIIRKQNSTFGMHFIVYHPQCRSLPSISILFGSLCSESRSQIAPEANMFILCYNKATLFWR